MLTSVYITEIKTENQFNRVYKKLVSLGNKEYSETLGGMKYSPDFYTMTVIKGLCLYADGDFWQLRYEIRKNEIVKGYKVIKASNFLKSK